MARVQFYQIDGERVMIDDRFIESVTTDEAFSDRSRAHTTVTLSSGKIYVVEGPYDKTLTTLNETPIRERR